MKRSGSSMNDCFFTPASPKSHGDGVAGEWMKRSKANFQPVVDLNPAVKKKRVLPHSFVSAGPSQRKSSYPSNSSLPSSRGSMPPKQAMGEIVRMNDEDDDIDLNTEYSLSMSQRRALDAIMRRQSVFFTGAAGTGKSFILKILQEVGKALNILDKICFTAPTGVAACNIGGLTLHSWSGIGQGSEGIELLLGMAERNRQAKQRWQETEILVIDEISMLSAELFDKLDIIGRRLRNNMHVFGGLQLILCGDFYQLPPVGLGKGVNFCFTSQAWGEIFDPNPQYNILLEKVFRQKDDQLFLDLLNELRIGVVSNDAQRILNNKVQQSLQHSEMSNSAVKPTKLFSTNKDVERVNLEELSQLIEEGGAGADGENNERHFKCIDEGAGRYLDQLRAGTKAPELLTLKIGAQVMLLKNLSTIDGLVNGARGIVIGFEKSNGKSNFYPYLPVVKFSVFMGKEKREEVVTLTHDTWDIKQGDKILASRIQIPLILAWAISIHKSQGMTIPLLEVSFRGMFEYGQAYVALSRATCLEGLTLTSFSGGAVRAHPMVRDFYEKLERKSREIERETGEGGTGGRDEEMKVKLRDFITIYSGEESVQTQKQRKEVDHSQWHEARRPNSNTAHDTKGGIGSRAYNNWLESKSPEKKSAPSPSPFYHFEYREGAGAGRGGTGVGGIGIGAGGVVGSQNSTSNNSNISNNNSNKKSSLIDLTQNNDEENTANGHNRRANSSLYNSTSVHARTSVLNVGTNANQYSSRTASVHNTIITYNNNVTNSTNNTSSNQGNSNTMSSASNISDELKRKIEENRLAALQKLEQYKKRREEETKRLMQGFNL